MKMDSKYLFLFLIPGPIFGMFFMTTDFRTPNTNGNNIDEERNNSNHKEQTLEDETIEKHQPEENSKDESENDEEASTGDVI